MRSLCRGGSRGRGTAGRVFVLPPALWVVVLSCGPTPPAPEPRGPVNAIEPADEPPPVDEPPQDLTGRLRVLYLEGEPRNEYRVLRAFLLKEKTVAAQVVLLEPNGAVVRATHGWTPLTGFPADLRGFDVIVVGDVALTDDQQRMIADSGKSIVFLAGLKHNPTRYRDGPLGALVPVEVTPREQIPAVRPVRTRDGMFHDVTQLAEEFESNQRVWEELGPVYWYWSVTRVKTGAVIVEGRDRQDRSQGPLMVAADSGGRRILFCATDELFNFRSLVTAQSHHGALWRRILKWAVGR